MTVLRDIAIDPVSHDLVFDGQHFATVEGRQAVAQRLLVKFSMFEGEWFLDLDAGIPYRDEILVKNPDINLVGTVLRREILSTEGVTGLREFDISFDSARRELSLSFVAETDEGDLPAALAPSPVTPGMFVLLFNESLFYYPR